MTKLLTITDKEHPEFERIFDETENVDLEEVAPEVIDGRADVKVSGGTVEQYDAAFVDIPAQNSVFGRVLIETMEEKNIKTNHTSLGYYITAKKNYLYHVLHERNIDAPKTAVIASVKAARNIENEIELPVIARKFDEMMETDKKKLETEQDINDFTEGFEYENTLIILQEYSEGSKYQCLVTEDDVISLVDDTEGWKMEEDSLKYSNLPKNLREKVKDALKSIGTPMAEVIIRDGEIVDMNPNPDLEMYTDKSGKNAFKAVSKVLED